MPSPNDPTEDLSADREFVRTKIEELRQRLLDLTGRNPLLNFRHPKGSSVRVVDELPNQVVTALQSKRSFAFESVPRPTEDLLIQHGYIKFDPVTGAEIERTTPTAEAWAKICGIETDYELPLDSSADGNHSDSKLQTLLFPDSLEARLRSVRSRANSAETEMGCNILYLAVGFLEWFDHDDSDLKRIAPLYTVPVDLARDRLNAQEGVFRYKIFPRDEDALDNITLREKLRSDFGLELPAIQDEEPPEAYFDKVKHTILKHQPRWKLHRYITLATFNFQKQAMYEDLDPDRWEGHHSILDHPLIREFFFATEQDEEEEHEVRSEYSIDSISDSIDRYPIVFDADSSQHSAIIDALEGNNLVIEGPPGTGKSQTITNLIAACIAAGKSVLFVAEKMAALEVVKNRLDRAGLGDFCLELHGHKAQKSEVLGAISKRMAQKYPAPREIAVEKQLFEAHRDTLNQHADRVNTPWKSTGKTPNEIFNAAVLHQSLNKVRGELPRLPGLSGDKLTSLEERKLLSDTQRLAELHKKVAEQTPDATLASHYWFGLRKVELLHGGTTSCTTALAGWTATLEALHTYLSSTLGALGFNPEHAWSVADLSQLEAAAAELPNLTGRERLESLPALARQVSSCTDALRENQAIHDEWDALDELLEDETLENSDAPQALDAALARLRPLGVRMTSTIGGVTAIERQVSALLQDCNPIQDGFATIRDRVPEALHPCLKLTRSGLREYLGLADIIHALPSELWRFRDDVFDNDDLDYLIEDLVGRLQDLISIREELEGTFELSSLPESREIAADLRTIQNAGLFRFFSGEWRRARKRVRSLTLGTKQARKRATKTLPLLIQYSRGLEEAAELNRENPALGGNYQGIDTPIERIAEIRRWYRSVREIYGSGFGARAEIAKTLFTMSRDTAVGVADYNAGTLYEQAQAIEQAIATVSSSIPDHSLAQSRDTSLAGDTGALAHALGELHPSLAALAPSFRSPETTLTQVREVSVRLSAHFETAQSWPDEHLQNALQETGFKLSAARGERTPNEVEALSDSLKVATALSQSTPLIHAFANHPGQARYEELRSIAATLRPLLDREDRSRAEFEDAGDVDLEAWAELSGNSLSALIAKNHGALSHEPWISDWLNYLRIKDSLIPNGLEDFIRHLEENAAEIESIESLTRAVINVQLAQEIFQEDSDLAKFYGPDQDGIRTQFQASDKRVIELKQAEIAAGVTKRRVPQGKTGGRVGDYTDKALLAHEIQKKKRHIALRDLLDRAGDATIALKPCFMMSPMSVATHLEPGRHQFDLVVMDEASQIKPEDALGSIARANSLVIVGDPKQLPPTSFFDRAIDGERESGDGVTLDDSESILEAVSGMFPTRQLRWHYRSRHESLIEFSASNFYDNNLVLFPSPFETNPEYGVKFHRVDDGFFQKVNKPEARAVVDFVIEHLRTSSDESIGVVAMSAAQSTLIAEEIEQRMKDAPDIRRMIDAQTQKEEPLFLKNLESVQGDERDVIVISMTYGPVAPGGTVPQRFGPINTNGGWRRLNVLFTRSKKRMHIFSSMSASDVSEGGGEGRKALHRFLAYCERRPMTDGVETERAIANDFEESVIRALRDAGYACTPQLGVAGYFLDIAVRDPKDPGRYLLGIECDGATYHSAKSARDRDRLRQEVLEGLGWKIARIWSTDWFRNPELQIQKIVNILKKLEEAESARN